MQIDGDCEQLIFVLFYSIHYFLLNPTDLFIQIFFSFSVTLNGASSGKCFQSWILLLFLFLLPMVMGQEHFGLSDYEEYDENSSITSHSFVSLVGG